MISVRALTVHSGCSREVRFGGDSVRCFDASAAGLQTANAGSGRSFEGLPLHHSYVMYDASLDGSVCVICVDLHDGSILRGITHQVTLDYEDLVLGPSVCIRDGWGTSKKN